MWEEGIPGSLGKDAQVHFLPLYSNGPTASIYPILSVSFVPSFFPSQLPSTHCSFPVPLVIPSLCLSGPLHV